MSSRVCGMIGVLAGHALVGCHHDPLNGLDGTPAYLEEVRLRPGPARVQVIRNEANLGFAAGCNQGLAGPRPICCVPRYGGDQGLAGHADPLGAVATR